MSSHKSRDRSGQR